MTCRGAEPPSTHARTVGKVPRGHWPSAQALCARLAAEGRSAALGAATAVVCWWRFDFAVFAAPPSRRRLRRGRGNATVGSEVIAASAWQWLAGWRGVDGAPRALDPTKHARGRHQRHGTEAPS